MKIFRFFFLFLLVFTGCISSSQTPIKERSREALVSHLKKSTLILLGRAPTSAIYESLCAGVWIDKHYILTARHCSEHFLMNDSEEESNFKRMYGMLVPIKPEVDSERTYSILNPPEHYAVIVAYDRHSDLSLLYSIDSLEHDYVELTKYKPFSGQTVHVVGHPGGESYTYVNGVVANDLSISKYFDNWKTVQISAPIWGGNSGGGVFDEDGNLIGIMSHIRKDIPNMAFAIHPSVTKEFVRDSRNAWEMWMKR